MTLECVGDEVIHMGEGTFMWVQLSHFRFDPADDDRTVLRELIDSSGFAHDYASPFPSSPQPSQAAVHGRWNLEAITAERFRRCNREHAVQVIHTWATEQEWTDPDYRQPEEALARLESVYDLLEAGSVYELDNPGSVDEHDYGFTTGNTGFHEFVVVDRAGVEVRVVVASDD